MALTWRNALPAELPERKAEGPAPEIEYLVERAAARLRFGVTMPGQERTQYPVEIVMGGTRHGYSLLARVDEVNGEKLARAPLVETRYLQYAPEGKLELSPGFPHEKPVGLETAIGRVLTPKFEEKCLSCHGQASRGVTCADCHAADAKHFRNPGKLPVAERMQTCSKCHAGFSKVVDPMPDDLLISDQVTALSNSECWRQSAGQITCTNCHDPHADAPRGELVARSEAACKTCHAAAAAAPHAALCPVNRVSGCLGCHMPDSEHSKPFVISDHWIRVHPEQQVAVPSAVPDWRSQVMPKRVFVSVLAMDNEQTIGRIREEIASGGTSFFEAARANSVDRASGVNGGYLGDLEAGELDPTWRGAALALQQGEVSPVVEGGGKYYLVRRMPRNFREEAEVHFDKAMELRKAGSRQESVNELLAALRIDPRLLRALTYLGVSSAEAGNVQAGAAILGVTTTEYPQDAGAHFNLGIAYGAMGDEREIGEYRKALDIDADYVPAYLNWGGTLFAKAKYEEAADVYRRGIAVNPLVASLHYSLSLALEKEQKGAEAERELKLAQGIDARAGK